MFFRLIHNHSKFNYLSVETKTLLLIKTPNGNGFTLKKQKVVNRKELRDEMMRPGTWRKSRQFITHHSELTTLFYPFKILFKHFYQFGMKRKFRIGICFVTLFYITITFF